jgi:polyisoprenoid-binding protein YceI
MTNTATAAATTYAIDAAHSSLEFAVKHMVFATAKGRFAEFSGTVDFDPSNVEASSVDVTINVASVTTNQAQRDGHLNSADFFDTETFPTATFKSTSVSGTPDKLKVVGDLTLKDVTRPVTLDAEFLGQGVNPFGQTVAAFSASTKINRTEFGLSYNAALETGGVLIGEDIKLSIELEMNPVQ